MRCRDLTGFVEACLDAYIDGELDDRDCGELEAHLAECEACCQAVRNQARLKSLIRDRAKAVRAPEHLLSRISTCLDDTENEALLQRSSELATREAQNDSVRDMVYSGRSMEGTGGATMLAAADKQAPPPWRSMPVFASVAFLLVFVWVASGGFAHDSLVDDAVRKHARSLPLEVTGPAESLQSWLRGKVDFNPDVLVFSSGLEPLGARLSHVRDHPAIYVGYGRPGSGPDGERQASLFAFIDPSFDPSIERRNHRKVGNREVVVTSRQGFNVVLWKENEIVYSLVSDLGERELITLVSEASKR